MGSEIPPDFMPATKCEFHDSAVVFVDDPDHPGTMLPFVKWVDDNREALKKPEAVNCPESKSRPHCKFCQSSIQAALASITPKLEENKGQWLEIARQQKTDKCLHF
jgi:hypothetical protein